jgi:two-component system, cell cycle sensor histidine kinase and response regulator CckA
MVFHENVTAQSVIGTPEKAPLIESRVPKEPSFSEICDESLYRCVFERAGAGIALVKLDGTVVASNPALQTMFGYTERELAGMHFSRVTAPEDVARDMGLFAALTRGEQASNSIEKHYVRKDGSRFWARRTVSIAHDKPKIFVCLIENIDSSHEVLEALRDNEARYRLLVEGSEQVFFYQQDADGRLLYVSPSVRKVLGYDAAEMLGVHYSRYAAPGSAQQRFIERTDDSVRDPKRRQPYTAECLRSDGRVVVLEFTSGPLKMRDGRTVIHGFARDVTAQRKAEAKLQLSDLILRSVETIILVGNGQGQIEFANDAATRTLGYPIEDLLGMGWWELHSHADPGAAIDRVASCARGECPIRTDSVIESVPDKKGRIHWIAWRDSKGPRDLLIGAGQDITELKVAEAAREKSELELRAIFENALDAMMILDDEGRYLDANPAACTLLGVPKDEVIGKRIGKIVSWSIDVAKEWERGTLDRLKGEATITLKNGVVREIEYAVKEHILPGLSLLLARDVTERKALELRLMQSQKMEALGRLAGGVAHDFNNMLMVIRGYSELMQTKTSADPLLARYTSSIIDAADRAALTTQQLLAFSRRQVIQPQIVNLNSIVDEMARLLRRVLGEDVELHLDLARDLYNIKADSGQMGQIILNLAINARDAMPTGGRLEISTRNEEVEELRMSGIAEPISGTFSVLRVKDSGSGMDAETCSHIFEPFFTTKPQGKGTGLGLAMVYGVVKQSKGWINVESELDRGTEFKLYFPRQGK